MSVNDGIKLILVITGCLCAIIFSFGACEVMTDKYDCPTGAMMYLGKCVAAVPVLEKDSLSEKTQ